MQTKEQILSAYLTDEHPSPVIEFLRMTTPNRDADVTGRTPTDKRVKAYLDAEEAKTHNPIIDRFK